MGYKSMNKVPKDLDEIILGINPRLEQFPDQLLEAKQAIAEYTDRKVREARIDGAIEELMMIRLDSDTQKIKDWIVSRRVKLVTNKAKLGQK